MSSTTDEQSIKSEAEAYARKNKKAIAKRLTDKAIFLPESNPVSVFMAGSPGAGKTESSKELLNEFKVREPNAPILRIDPDDLRGEFGAYTGSNSYLFQFAISVLVDKILDLAFEQRQSFLLDGTLSNIDIARKNIRRCLGRD